jgi:hypothetical protein
MHQMEEVMATIKYFSGQNEVANPHGLDNASFAAFYPGVKGLRYDSFQKLVGYDQDKVMLPIERRIEFKSNPSLHVCNAKCMNATGRICECSCGGKNHGYGGFRCE